MVTPQNAQISPIWAFLLPILVTLAVKWQDSWQKQGLQKTKKDAFPYELAHLSRPKLMADGSENLDGQWVVVYRVWSEQRECLVRKRITCTAATLKERLAEAEKYIKQINKLLREGVAVELIPKLEKPTSKLPAGAITEQSTVLAALKFFQSFKDKTLKKQSKRTYQSCSRQFEDYLLTKKLKHLKLKLFDNAQAHAYLDYIKLEQDGSNHKYNKQKGYAFTLFNFFVETRKVLSTNPFNDISKLPTTAGRHYPFLLEQVNEFKKYFRENPDPQLWLFINFIYYTFSRPHEEVRRIQVRDINRKTLIIYGDSAKNSMSNPKRIAAPLETLINEHGLRSYPPHYYIFSRSGQPGPEPVGESYFYERHKKALLSIGLPIGQYDIYGWKHTGVIALYQHTKDMKLIQRMCAHSTITTTEIYLRDLGLFLDDEELNGFPVL